MSNLQPINPYTLNKRLQEAEARIAELTSENEELKEQLQSVEEVSDE